jgi:hypothetical protein
MLQVIDAHLATEPATGRANQQKQRDKLLNRLVDAWTGRTGNGDLLDAEAVP